MSSFNHTLPTPEDIRAARAYKGWNQGELAQLSGVSKMFIAKIEQRNATPSLDILKKIHKAFWEADIEFIQGGGFKTRQDLVKVYQTNEELRQFFDDVYFTAQKTEEEFLVYGVDERKFLEAHKKAGLYPHHRERMKQLHKIFFRIIVGESDENASAAPYAKYRKVPDSTISVNVPFYIYGKKVAVILWREDPKIIVLHDQELTAAYRKQFEFVWQSAKEVK